MIIDGIRVDKVLLEGYKPFYAYVDGNELIIYVNEQSQFQEGLCDVNFKSRLMTAEEAEKARTMSVEVVNEPKNEENENFYTGRLTANGYKLQPE